MLPKIYIETTIVSYLTGRPSRSILARAHQVVTKRWWDERREHFDLYSSQLVLDEAARGDADAAKRRLDLLAEPKVLRLTDDAKELARALIAGNHVPANQAEDALHISLAAVHGMKYLLTWNCKHIANAEIRPGVEQLCLKKNYVCPVICTPEELMGA